MNKPNSSRRKLLTIIGIFAVIMITIIAPTPVHHWLADHSVNGIPLEAAVIALVILFTPVTVLVTIMRKFDVDFVDESADDIVPHAH